METRPNRTSDAGIGLAMVCFLAIIYGIMLLVHFLQPAGQETKSSSPAHQAGEK